MEQLAHFVTKSFEYNNNRVMDVINMTQNTRSMLCSGDPFRSVGASVDRMSTKGAIRGTTDDDAYSGLDDDENTMDIDITDFSSDDEDVGGGGGRTEKPMGFGARAADLECVVRRDNSERTIASTLLRLSATNFRNAMGRLDKDCGEVNAVLGRTIHNSADLLAAETTQQEMKRKYTTKNWLISDSPKKESNSGMLDFGCILRRELSN